MQPPPSVPELRLSRPLRKALTAYRFTDEDRVVPVLFGELLGLTDAQLRASMERLPEEATGLFRLNTPTHQAAFPVLRLTWLERWLHSIRPRARKQQQAHAELLDMARRFGPSGRLPDAVITLISDEFEFHGEPGEPRPLAFSRSSLEMTRAESAS
jgi:hypothetical protein